jgi:hypothetical protein
VSRTGYNEIDVINPTTKNIKLTGAIHYKINDDIEASISGYTGQGNTVYTGSDRYSLVDLKMSQFKFELKSKDWFIRAYTTMENSGNSFNSTIASRYFKHGKQVLHGIRRMPVRSLLQEMPVWIIWLHMLLLEQKLTKVVQQQISLKIQDGNQLLAHLFQKAVHCS